MKLSPTSKSAPLLIGLAALISGLQMISCGSEGVTPPNNEGEIVSDAGGFVITKSMLEKRYNQLTYPGTHNSFSGPPGLWLDITCRNQDISISEQLENGIRYIEFDVDKVLHVSHGGCIDDFNSRLTEVRNYAIKNPYQIITVRISDLVTLTPNDAYSRINGRLVDTELDEYVFNWNPAPEIAYDNPAKCFIPDPWPTIGEMIDSGRNVMFIHNRGTTSHNVVDSGYFRGLDEHDFWDNNHHDLYSARDVEELSWWQNVWDPANCDRQVEGESRLFIAECYPDVDGAGNRVRATVNNDGRKLYQLGKQHEEHLLPGARVCNFISVDFFMGNEIGQALPICVVDACNRLNFERFGLDWKSAPCFWEMHPHEFDASRTEYISQAAHLKAETDAAILGWRQHGYSGLVEREDSGDITATSQRRWYDWCRLPEWALDNDYFTRWSASGTDPGHAWAVDLGDTVPIDEVAIAWDFSHRRPAYALYVSNHPNFAPLISNWHLTHEAEWTLAYSQPTETYGISPPEMWDVVHMDLDQNEWRFIKIVVTDASPSAWPRFFEVKVYGP